MFRDPQSSCLTGPGIDPIERALRDCRLLTEDLLKHSLSILAVAPQPLTSAAPASRSMTKTDFATRMLHVATIISQLSGVLDVPENRVVPLLAPFSSRDIPDRKDWSHVCALYMIEKEIVQTTRRFLDECLLAERSGILRSLVVSWSSLSDEGAAAALVKVFEAFAVSVKLVRLAFSKLEATKASDGKVKVWTCRAVADFLQSEGSGLEGQLFAQFYDCLGLRDDKFLKRAQPPQIEASATAEKSNFIQRAISAVSSSSKPAPSSPFTATAASSAVTTSFILRRAREFVRTTLVREWDRESVAREMIHAKAFVQMLVHIQANPSVESIVADAISDVLARRAAPSQLDGEGGGGAGGEDAAGQWIKETALLIERTVGERSASWLPRQAVHRARLAVLRGVFGQAGRTAAVVTAACRRVVSTGDVAVLQALYYIDAQCQLCRSVSGGGSSSSSSGGERAPLVSFDFVQSFVQACQCQLRMAIAGPLGCSASADELAATATRTSCLTATSLSELMQGVLGYYRDVDHLLGKSSIPAASLPPRQVDLKIAAAKGASSVLSNLAVVFSSVVNEHMSHQRRSPTEHQDLLDFITFVGPCVEDCDAFMASVVLAAESRLLDVDCIVDDERSLANHLRRVFIASTLEVRKFVTMLNDVESSRMLSDKLAPEIERLLKSSSSPSNSAAGTVVALKVLSANAWSPTMALRIRLPPLLDSVRAFAERRYSKEYGRRLLTWNWLKSNVTLRTLYLNNRRSVELLVPMAVASILLEMDVVGSDVLDAEQVERVTDAENRQTRVALHRMEQMQLVSMRSSAASKATTTVGVIELNRSCQLQQKRVSLLPKRLAAQPASAAATVAKNKQQQDESTAENIALERRRFVLQAAVISVMKSARSLDFASLCEGVVGILRGKFAPASSDIKRTVEQLLEKDYLERDACDRNQFLYKA